MYRVQLYSRNSLYGGPISEHKIVATKIVFNELENSEQYVVKIAAISSKESFVKLSLKQLNSTITRHDNFFLKNF